MQGFLDFDESFDSFITGTLALFLSSTTPSSVSVLPIPLALSCRTLNVLSSLICSADGAGVGGGEGGDCWVFDAKQGLEVVRVVIAGSLMPSRGCMSNLYFRPEHVACTHTEHLLHW